MSSKKVCKIKFRDSETNKIHKIIGEIDTNQSKENRWISVKSLIQKQGKWIEVNNSIFKGDIITLIIYKSESKMTFDNVLLEVNKMILEELLEL